MKTIKNTLIVVAALVVATVAAFKINQPKHHCTWEDCNYQGKVVTVNSFESTWGCEEWTDCFLVELTHVAQPTWTYEACEEYVFQGVE